ncbi:MAG: hypothetical protein PHU54_05525 [Candidatus Omnitrophica bacterium]|nr:hypothetical protein [Candidatus Omnitrophota bacterium]
MNPNPNLRLRQGYQGRAGKRLMYRNRMQSGGGGAPAMGFGGDPVDNSVAGNILEAGDPVGLYITGCQKLFGMPEDKQTGVWDHATHQAMTEWVGRIDEPSDMKDMPSWGEAPAWTAKFVTDLALAPMRIPALIPTVQTILSHIGAPVSNNAALLAFFRGEGAGSATWKRTMAIFDSVALYVIGCEGGVAYGSPAVQTEGIVAGALAFAGSVAGILLVG